MSATKTCGTCEVELPAHLIHDFAQGGYSQGEGWVKTSRICLLCALKESSRSSGVPLDKLPLGAGAKARLAEALEYLEKTNRVNVDAEARVGG